MLENIQNSVHAVLDKYSKTYKISAVATNLKSWQKHKLPLIDLLRKHPNWRESELAVIFEITENRDIDRQEVVNYIESLSSNDFVISLSDEEKIKFRNALFSSIGDYSKFVTSESAIADVKKQCDIKCAVGQKTSRVINAICQKFNVTKVENYNALFAKLADSLNPLQVKKKAVLSVNPCDYLEMSNKINSWHSCHCLDGGEYHAGTLSYMNDEVSAIFFTVDDGIIDNFSIAPKRSRQVFAYEKGILLQSRLYPNTNDETARDAYRNIVQRTIADCLNLPNLWALKREQDEVSRRIKTHENALHYPDYEYKSFKSNISLLKEIEVKDDDFLTVGNTSYCINCASQNYENNYLYCDDCADSDYVTCNDCGHRLHRDDARYIGENWYCEDCCCYCNHCDEYTVGDTFAVHDQHGYETYVCENCLGDFIYCEECDAYYHPDNVRESEGGESFCKECYENIFTTCEKCGTELKKEDDKTENNEILCENCNENNQKEKDDFDSADCGQNQTQVKIYA